jgi:imidazole glycerol phosphate synthase glutamine amidotransferase subunit
MITLIDYGAGNLHSLQGALTRLGFQSVRAVTPAEAAESGTLILPGVGHFTAARARLVERGWWDVLPGLAATRPVLGICLGLQLLADGSEESPGAKGLGLVPGMSRLLGPGVKVPNMGWAKVKARKAHPALPDFQEDWLYFVHSYALDSDDETVLESTHGRAFSAMQARGRVLGFQGHPEKSGPFGESLLRGVLGWMGEVPCV